MNILCSSLQTPELPSLFSRSAGPALSETASTVEAPLPCFARFAVFPRLQPKTKQKQKTKKQGTITRRSTSCYEFYKTDKAAFFANSFYGSPEAVSFNQSAFHAHSFKIGNFVISTRSLEKKRTVFLPFEVKNNLSLVGNLSA